MSIQFSHSNLTIDSLTFCHMGIEWRRRWMNIGGDRGLWRCVHINTFSTTSPIIVKKICHTTHRVKHEHNQQHKNMMWKILKLENHCRFLNRQLKNKYYVKIITTYISHPQPPHDSSTPTLSQSKYLNWGS